MSVFLREKTLLIVREGVVMANVSNHIKKINVLILSLIIFFILQTSGLCKTLPDLTELGLEELMNIEVTSVSKKPQKLSNAAAAIFVITTEDIRRSGATSIPEALRMVPGLEVARSDANKWAITSRGFNGGFANKLLVLMDGRSVYTPLYSGVFWDQQDTMLEDLDRIEIIRGPGATLWGANAVNGVINIITKKAKETQGWLATVGAGSEEKRFCGVRYGGKSGENTKYRLYAKYFDRDDSVYFSGDDAVDGWHVLRTGFRIDSKTQIGDQITFQGDIFNGKSGEEINIAAPGSIQTVNQKTDFNGGNILGRWNRYFSDSSNIAIQVYYDRTDISSRSMVEIRDTIDVDIQHQFLWGERHGIVWGCGYRFTRDNIDNSISSILIPDRRHDDLWSAFLQDEISFNDDKIKLTIGSKFEHNDYSGFEIQPNIRAIWSPHNLYSIWAAVSRAVRTPSRAESDLMYYGAIPSFPFVSRLYGNEDFDSEDLIAYEIGFRIYPDDHLFLDLATFYNDYDNLRTLEFGGINAAPLFLRLDAGNKMEASSYGVELSVDYKPFNWWSLAGAYTLLRMQLHVDGDSTDMSSENAEGESPHHQISLRSSMDLPHDIELDLWTRYVDSLPSQDIGSYITLDIRLGWELRKDIELSICGQNLLDGQHPEFEPEIVQTTPTEVERSVYGKITFKF